MKLITISGLDGSGKSTQINLLKNYLENQGRRVFYFHAIEFGLAKKIIDFRNKYCLFCRLMGKCKVYKEKSVTSANKLQIFLRKLFLRIDIWSFKKLYSQLEKENYDYILSDRYFYDSIVNIEYLEANNSKAKFLASLGIPAPNLAIYLQTNPEKIIEREKKPDQGLEYLQKKKELYDAKISIWNMQIINGNQEKEQIFAQLKELTPDYAR